MLLPTMNVNRRAVLNTIGDSEGTTSSPITKQSGYDAIVTGLNGPSVFTDFSCHPFQKRPPIMVNTHGLASTAAGKYQILLRFWLASAKAHHYVDFSPYWQDMYVLQAFRERNALDLIDNGRFEDCIAAINGLWASLPGKQYVGQAQRPMSWLLAKYKAEGGLLVPANSPNGDPTLPHIPGTTQFQDLPT